MVDLTASRVDDRLPSLATILTIIPVATVGLNHLHMTMKGYYFPLLCCYSPTLRHRLLARFPYTVFQLSRRVHLRFARRALS